MRAPRLRASSGRSRRARKASVFLQKDRPVSTLRVAEGTHLWRTNNEIAVVDADPRPRARRLLAHGWQQEREHQSDLEGPDPGVVRLPEGGRRAEAGERRAVQGGAGAAGSDCRAEGARGSAGQGAGPAGEGRAGPATGAAVVAAGAAGGAELAAAGAAVPEVRGEHAPDASPGEPEVLVSGPQHQRQGLPGFLGFPEGPCRRSRHEPPAQRLDRDYRRREVLVGEADPAGQRRARVVPDGRRPGAGAEDRREVEPGLVVLRLRKLRIVGLVRLL